MFSVILKRWMKSYALTNGYPINPSYIHPILHILAYVAILRDPTTAQNESHRCVCMCVRTRVIMVCVCACTCTRVIMVCVCTCTRVIMLCVCVCVHMFEYSGSMTAAVLKNTKILPVHEKFVY